MNPSHGNGKTGSSNAFDFDLGLSSGRPQSMKDLKNQTTTNNYNTSGSTWNQRSSKPAWTHQPAASVQSGMKGSLSGPTSMVGDIFGKTWNSSSVSSNLGLVDSKNSNLFGDLLNAATGLNKSGNSVPLKNVATAAGQSSFSMGYFADSLPKTSYSVKSSGTPSSNSRLGGGSTIPFGTNKPSSSLGDANVSLGVKGNSHQTLAGPSMKSMTGNGVRKDSNHDPFASFVDFGAKPRPPGYMGNTSKDSEKKNLGSDSFGEFQNPAPQIGVSSISAGVSPGSFNDPLGGFGVSVTPGSRVQSSRQNSLLNDFDSLFSSEPATGIEKVSSQPFSDDWGINSDFPGGNDKNVAPDIEGLSRRPVGISASSAKIKGMENYKQGQFADAIKWLSWAFVLLEKASDVNELAEVLTSRASCYKEVGEYRKAVADCSKVLEHDSKNVAALVQRALLYESMEKYKLGAEDLRTVMKLDPGNRIARSTIHRLTKLAE